MNRREFLCRGAAAAAAVAAPGILAGRGALRIDRIAVQLARGRRETPVAPNAYAPFRGYEVAETIVRVRTAQGIEGIGRITGKAADRREALAGLLGLDPFALFDWESDVARGPAEGREDLLDRLSGADTALLDLLGKALKRPVADLLGRRRRETVKVYDSSLYMEDLLRPSEREGLAYLEGPAPADDAEMVARKALWVLGKPEGIRILKIKIGRAKWMGSFEEALRRDIAVVRAVRAAAGESAVLFVDGNNGYEPRPGAAAVFAEGTAAAKVYAMEEMFPEEKAAEHRAVKRRMRRAGIATRLADGEGHRGGIPEKLLAERFEAEEGEGEPGPLFDINQPDMNENGFLRMRALAAISARHDLTIAPHNFGSKMGFWSQVHLGLTAANWEFSETDDGAFPALEAPGIRIDKGLASLTGEPGLGVTLREEKLEKPILALEA